MAQSVVLKNAIPKLNKDKFYFMKGTTLMSADRNKKGGKKGRTISCRAKSAPKKTVKRKLIKKSTLMPSARVSFSTSKRVVKRKIAPKKKVVKKKVATKRKAVKKSVVVNMRKKTTKKKSSSKKSLVNKRRK